MTVLWRRIETTVQLAARRPRFGPALVIASNILPQSVPVPREAGVRGGATSALPDARRPERKRRRSLHTAGFPVNARSSAWIRRLRAPLAESRSGAGKGERLHSRRADSP